MTEIAGLGVVIILTFIAFVMLWNRRWQGELLDEREADIRLRVRTMISRAVEITLVAAIGFHFFVRAISGLEALVTIGLTGVLAEAFANWYLRRNDLRLPGPDL